MGFTRIRYGIGSDGRLRKEVAEYLLVGEDGVREIDPRLTTVKGVEGKVFLLSVSDLLVDPIHITNTDKENNLENAPLEEGTVLLSEEDFNKYLLLEKEKLESLYAQADARQAEFNKEQAANKDKKDKIFKKLGLSDEEIDILLT